jgi:hypothetical protein
MKRADIFSLSFILAAVCVIYAPLFDTNYLYTDEGYQLWFSKTTPVLQTFQMQGRYITYKLFQALFGSADKTAEVTHIRLFSLFGWVICLPVWYFILKDLIAKNALPKILTLFSMVYLISMPSFTIYVSWGSVSELFIACTAGLVSGYLFYKNIYRADKKWQSSFLLNFLSILSGVISLFTYQNGFGCFFIPFFIQFIASGKISRKMINGLAFSLIIFTGYFLLFKLNLWATGIGASERSALTTNPLGKLVYIFYKPLASAFHFTWLFTEGSRTGKIFYLLMFIFWIGLNQFRKKQGSARDKSIYYLVIYVFIIFIYLPSLVVKEDYASNRTLFALNFCVFLMVAETVFSFFKTTRHQLVLAGTVAAIFLVNGWYNFRTEFLGPVKNEFDLVKNYVWDHYNPGVDSIYFIRPAENAFVRKYHITASWDEFGVPSTSMAWVPEPLIRQLIYEKTGDRKQAEKIVVQSWPNMAAFSASGEQLPKGKLLINVDDLLDLP